MASRFESWLIGHASELATTGITPTTLREDARRYAKGLERVGTAMLQDWLAGLSR